MTTWKRGAALAFGLGAWIGLGALIEGCEESRGRTGPPGASATPAPIPTNVGRDEPLPGVTVEILSVAPGSGPGGNLLPGDRVAVTYRVTTEDGRSWTLDELAGGEAVVAGPTFNRQLVLGPRTDVLSASAENPDGSFTYTFEDPVPQLFPPPLNDSPAFDQDDGELQGTALVDGTYTVGLRVHQQFTVEGETVRDPGVDTQDFLLGTSTSLEGLVRREVVSDANCRECHVNVLAHGNTRMFVSYCVLCHTAGAEDRNVAAVESGTPAVSIDFDVLIHRIHNGAHLPSVLGVSTASDGSRVYTDPPRPFTVVGNRDRVFDFSEIEWPVMPSAYVAYVFDQTGTTFRWAAGNGPMPRDVGYSTLPPEHRLKEDRIRAGNVSCVKCHGDPDDAGPVAAPAQGEVAFAQPTRHACGSCHDDVDWSKPYTANGMTMPPQPDDTRCIDCHTPSGTPLSGTLATTRAAHLHPYTDPDLNTGVNVTISAVTSGGTPGNLQPGSAITPTFSVTDDAGVDLSLHSLTRFQMIATGPTTNPQVILRNVNMIDFALRRSSPFTGDGRASAPSVATNATEQTLAVAFTGDNVFDVVGSSSGTLASGLIVPEDGDTGLMTFAGVSFTIFDGTTNFAAGDRLYFEVIPPRSSYTMSIPTDLARERVGTASGAAQGLAVGNPPLYWGRQQVWERTAVQAGSALAADAALFQPYVVVDLAALPGVALNDVVALDVGGPTEEYLQVTRLQTTDDRTGADLGGQDRLWFADATFLRYAHAAGTPIAEVTLTPRLEGIDYTVPITGARANGIDLVPGRFTAGNPVVVSYRTDGRFGHVPAPGEDRHDLYLPAPADEDEIDQSWGDWKGLPFLAGTYTVGAWANVDFTLSPFREVVPTEPWNRDPVTDNTTYRMISRPATLPFLFGVDMVLAGRREIISDHAACNRCHGDLQAHGFGRRGLETCLVCHTVSGMEDGSKRTFATWYVGPTPGVTVDFRTLLHKVHMGGDLFDSEGYAVNGVFLANPYPVTYEGHSPAMPGGTARCTVCHGENNTAWLEPAPRDHPAQQVPVRAWRAVCGSCHDSPSAAAHIDVQTAPNGVESCVICHGPGRPESVQVVHENEQRPADERPRDEGAGVGPSARAR